MGFLNLGLRLYFQVLPNSQRDSSLGFLNVALAGIVNFSQFMEEIKNWEFGILPSFSQFTKQLQNWDFFPCFHILSDCEEFLSGRVYVLGRGAGSHYVTILW